MVQHWTIRFVALALAVALAPSAAALEVVRGPYLQQATASGVIIRWRTDTPTVGVVRYGLAPSALDQSTVAGVSSTEHEVALVGLSSSTRYYYSVGDADGPLAGDSSHVFTSAPPDGQSVPTRIWVLGDSGTANANARAVRDAYKTYTGARGTDLWLMLGDNAYPDGTDAEYQAAMFDTYPETLRQAAVWPTLGNHDGHTADSQTQSGPYYDIFSLPHNAQAGGIASGTEAYYSFDYGNIHFVVLDSYETDRAADGAMMTWLENDLAANLHEWVIAFWHHPPYSKGSHNSDTEGMLVDMRNNALPLLESYGVDLVLTGHSHSYERSFLLNGHYGTSDTLVSAMILDGGDGRVGGDGPYTKPSGIAQANMGAVYAVAGSSGQISGGSLDHPAMFLSISQLGSMVLDIDELRLDAVFLSSAGQITDSFTIDKGNGTDTTPPSLVDVSAPTNSQVQLTFSESLDAASATDIGHYSIDGSISVTNATLSLNNRDVTLVTTPLVLNAQYVLTVNDVSDSAGNVIAANTSATLSFSESNEVTFQNAVTPSAEYAGTTDTYLKQTDPTTVFGADTTLLLDGDDPVGSGNDLVGLLRFELVGMPVGATVTAVSLGLTVFNSSSQRYDIFAARRPWDEDAANWTQATTAAAWDSPGAQGAGDRGDLILGSVFGSSTGAYTTALNAAGVELVQAWVDGTAPNHGFVLSGVTSTDGLDIYSSEYDATLSFRPAMTVTYTPAPDSDADGVVDALDNCTLIHNPAQIDSNADGYGNRCDADLNNDCVVNVADLGLLRQVFFQANADADLNSDGTVNIGDLGLMRLAFFAPPGPSGVAPSCVFGAAGNPRTN